MATGQPDSQTAAINDVEGARNIVGAIDRSSFLAPIIVTLLLAQLLTLRHSMVDQALNQACLIHHPCTMVIVPIPIRAPNPNARDLRVTEAQLKRIALILLYSWPLSKVTRLARTLWRQE